MENSYLCLIPTENRHWESKDKASLGAAYNAVVAHFLKALETLLREEFAIETV